MAETIETVPGTDYLVDVNHKGDLQHAGNAGSSDIVLIPQPTECGADPLRWPRWKKYYQLFLVALYACAFSYGENTLGAGELSSNGKQKSSVLKTDQSSLDNGI